MAGRGGKRSRAGRPKSEPSKVVRVPVGVLGQIEQIISNYKNGSSSCSVDPVPSYKTQLKSEALKAKSELLSKAKSFESDFDSLPRTERRSLIKKYGTKKAVLQAFCDTYGEMV